MKYQKLELTWIGKENVSHLEPRILLEDASLSYHAPHRVTDRDIFDNRLIFGDNLLALKALEQEFAGKIQCIFIDPPYNTGSAFEHYDDGVEHSLWLTLMRDRLELLKRLLSRADGSIWITIDDSEAHYLKVLCDEVFGRGNFVANLIWQKKYSPANDAKWFSDSHDHLLVYAADKVSWRPYRLQRSDSSNAAYENPDNDPRGSWKPGDYTCNKSADERPNLYYEIKQPNTGEVILPKRSRVWAYSESQHLENQALSLVWWGRHGTNKVPAFKRHLTSLEKGAVAQSILSWKDVGHTQDAKREQLELNPDDPFSTPKPERLLGFVLESATRAGDLVLDSFGGSGTTGAVAHKMGRKWIVVESGQHCETHIVPRLRKVIDGIDHGGVSPILEWKGGGGFRHFRLAPSLLERDKYGNWVISKQYNAAMLSEALCKFEGFVYAPSDTLYWQHGHSTERDFIYVTTQNLNPQQIAALSDDVGENRSLLVFCTSFRGKSDRFPNLTLKKIPKAVLNRCEWGKDDYSLAVANLPMKEPEPEAEALPAKSNNAAPPGQGSLFSGEQDA
jgi:adenine-specific DNA-methyltransferase